MTIIFGHTGKHLAVKIRRWMIGIIEWMAMGLFVGVSAHLSYWYFLDHAPPIQELAPPIVESIFQNHRGEYVLSVTWNIRKLRTLEDCPEGSSVVRLISNDDNIGIVLRYYTVPLYHKGDHIDHTAYVLPDNIQFNRPYQLRRSYRFICNPLHRALTMDSTPVTVWMYVP